MAEKTDNHQHWKVLVIVLKLIALKQGMSQDEIATRTGYYRQHINRLFSLRYCPRLDIFLNIAKAVGVNFFIEDKEGNTELNQLLEQAMDQLGRRPDNLPKN